MAVQISILGLGQIGVSMGLALASSKDQITRVGSDASGDVMRQAQKLGATDRTTINLPDAVRQSDAVLLCVPLNELRKTMEAIRQDLKPGVVVLDTSPSPLLAAAWAQELFPPQNCYFLSFTPALNPAYLMEGAAGDAKLHNDLFQNSNIFIAHSVGIDSSAIEFSENLAYLLGSSPVFADAMEVEGLLALTRWLPALSSAAVLGAAANQPGWTEARRLAGADYAYAGLALSGFRNGDEPAIGLVGSKENALRMIDLMTEELERMREFITADNQAELAARFEKNLRSRESWLRQRTLSKWEDEKEKRPPLPSIGSRLGRLVGIRPRDERK
jgi:prephenate dehydrogenase